VGDGSRLIALATQHGKERVLARPFRWGLGLTLLRADQLDTDRFGSFSGEHARPADALSTCRMKAEAAMRLTGLELGLASEGAFGPHPAVPMLAVGQEWMVYIDGPRQLLIHEHGISPRTNYAARALRRGDDLGPWLRAVGFPSHGLMVRPHLPEGSAQASWLAKGIHEHGGLLQLLDQAAALSPEGLAWLETDMRAHCNPTRMASIRRLAFRLVRRVRSTCPACGTPGWGKVKAVAGLPCGACGLATPLELEEEWGCIRCDHRQRHPRRDQRRSADPMHCGWCNP